MIGSVYYQVSNSLTLTPLPGLAGSSVNALYGLWGMTNGHLIAGTDQGMLDINPSDGSYVVIGPGSGLDGVSVSPDQTIAYGEYGGNSVLGYSITSPDPGTPVFNSGTIGRRPGRHRRDQRRHAQRRHRGNNNNGRPRLALIDPSLLTTDPGYYTIIADGGTRGDLVAPDTLQRHPVPYPV